MDLKPVEPAALSDTPAHLVDLDRYPLLDLTSPAAHRVIRWAQDQLASTGACELPDFVPADGLETVIADARALAPLAYRSTGVGSAYLEVPDSTLPSQHPRRILGEYAVGVVAYDVFPPDSPLRQLDE